MTREKKSETQPEKNTVSVDLAEEFKKNLVIPLNEEIKTTAQNFVLDTTKTISSTLPQMYTNEPESSNEFDKNTPQEVAPNQGSNEDATELNSEAPVVNGSENIIESEKESVTIQPTKPTKNHVEVVSERKESISSKKGPHKKSAESMKLVEKIDINKKDENLDAVRKNNTKIENGQVPEKTRPGFCTNCLIF